jgi:hypothetical protein
MNIRPILMSAPMVRAILEGRKTQTRRIVKASKSMLECGFIKLEPDVSKCPYGQPGDFLWVKETHQANPIYGSPVYRADYLLQNGRYGPNPVNAENWPWRPSIFMPRRLSRITLEITKVRIERLQDISEEDAIAEGIEYRDDIGIDRSFKFYGKVLEKLDQWTPLPKWSYQTLWESINGPGSWAANPWVWAITFKIIV